MTHYKIVYSVLEDFLSCDKVEGELSKMFGEEEFIAMMYSGQYLYHTHADSALAAVKKFMKRMEESMIGGKKA